jgi:hypothetical protein
MMTNIKIGDRVRLIKSHLTEAQVVCLRRDRLYYPPVGSVGTVVKTILSKYIEDDGMVPVKFDDGKYKYGIWNTPTVMLEVINDEVESNG